ncbi:family 5 glycoside hydrolase [Xylogone sp. PMI_703]|nr:family 5 glycoside hydrolase [Xylogone sp. PMI_703]
MKSATYLLAAAAALGAAQQPYTEDTDLTATISVSTYQRFQTMVGSGCSGSFQRARDIFGRSGLSPQKQKEVIAFLFDPSLGANRILRNGIGSSPNSTLDHMNSILPVCPPTPAGPFHYKWDGDDSAQFALAKAALSHNKDMVIYADAWSAPGCMKNVGVDSQGGLLCGVRGSNCKHDWRQAYADYIVQLIKFYKQEGITISAVGPFNEPDYNPITYAAMLSDGYQAKDALEYIYPTVKKAYPNVSVACCDDTGARQARTKLYELQKAGGGDLVDITTYHSYQSDPQRPFNTHKQAWMTEWADGGGGWNPNWDVVGHMAEGFQWAAYMHNAFVNADTSAWVHWQCAENNTGDNALIRLAGDNYFVSGRLWAQAGYFRFVENGAQRIAASTSVEEVYVSAFQNPDGTIAIPILNAAQNPYTVTIDLFGSDATTAAAWLTDNKHNVTHVGTDKIKNGSFKVTVEPRALKTYVLSGDAPGKHPQHPHGWRA